MLILSGHVRRVHTLAFSPDGRTLASVGGRGTRVWLWDLQTGQPNQEIAHNRRVISATFASGERPVLATCDSSGHIYLWDTEATEPKPRYLRRVAPMPGHPPRLVFSPDGHLLATSSAPPGQPRMSRSGRVTLWDWAGGGHDKDVLDLPRGPTSLAFSPDGRRLVVGALDDHVYVYDLETGTLVGNLMHGTTVHFVAFGPDNRTFAAASQGGLIKVFDAECLAKRRTLKGQGKALHAIAYAPDGRTIASASGDGRVRFWDVDSGRPRAAFDWGVGELHAITFAPDGFRAAAGGDQDIVLWDIGWG